MFSGTPRFVQPHDSGEAHMLCFSSLAAVACAFLFPPSFASRRPVRYGHVKNKKKNNLFMELTNPHRYATHVLKLLLWGFHFLIERSSSRSSSPKKMLHKRATICHVDDCVIEEAVCNLERPLVVFCTKQKMCQLGLGN
jgi:hypothetical protein